MKLLTIVGARPQFIKAAAVSREIKKNNNFQEIIIHTGQHYDYNMSDIFFKEMSIPKPNYNLNIHGLSHGAMTGQMLEKIEEVLIKEKPDCVIVYGDTNSTLAGSLAASKLHIPIAHIEAGLRSFNMKMPEEINRILTDRISDFLFCPTDVSISNLKKEGYDNLNCKIIKTGDVMQDAAVFYAEQSYDKSNIIRKLKLDKFALVTIHRSENTDNKENISGIFKALIEISKNIKVVIPLHPRTKNILKSLSLDISNLIIIDPVSYFDMIELLKKCSIVMTDSGGLQKEAFFFKKPCVTLRTETEWVELVEFGFNLVVGSNEERIIEAYKNMIGKVIPENLDLYGNGLASLKIISSLSKFLS